MQQTPISKKLEWFNLRWLIALLGLALLIVGQVQIVDDKVPLTPATELGKWLTEQLHLSIPSIDNVLHGLPFLLVGAVLLFVSLRGLRLLPSDSPLSTGIPVAFRHLRSVWPWLAAGTGLFGVLLWQLNALTYYPLLILQWLATLLFFAIAAAICDHRRQVNISPGLGRIDMLWMLGLFTLSIIIGAYRLQGLPDMLMGDEGSFWTAARAIATGSFQPPIFANGVYTFPVLSSIGQAWTLKLFGLNLWGWRFGSVLAGALTIFPLYLLGRDTFNRKVAIVSCIALAFSPYFLAFARLGYNNIQSLFITTLTLYWLYIGTQRSSIFYLFLAGCAAGFGFYTYFAARMAIVIAVLFLFALSIGRKIKFRHALLALVVLLLGATLVIGPYLVYGVHSDATGMSYKTFESVFFNTFNGLQFYSREELTAVAPIFKIGGNELFYNPKIYLVLLVRGLIRTMLIFQKPWLISEHFIAFPLAGTVGVIFYLIGFGAMFKRIKEPRSLLLLTWFLVTIFGLSILNTVPPRHTHMVSIIPLLALLTGIGIHIIASAIVAIHRSFSRLKPIFLGILTTMVALGGAYDYFLLMPSRYHPRPDQIISWAGLYVKDEALVFVYSDESELDIVRPYLITEFHPEVSYETISFDQFRANPQAFEDKKYIIFYMPDLAKDIEPILMQTWGTSLVRRYFYSQDGIPVLSAGMNTPFVFERDRSLGAIVRESYGHLPLLTFLGILVVLFGLIAFFPMAWTAHLPRRFKALAGWFDAPVHPPEMEEEPVEIIDISPFPPEPEPQPAEPPEWVGQVFASQPTKKPARVKIEGRSGHGQEGCDLYLHVHVPIIHLPRSPLPEGWRISVPDLAIPAPLSLVTAVTAAILAQVLVYVDSFAAGVIFYAVSAAALVIWMRRNSKWRNVLVNQVHVPSRAEMVIGILLLAVIIFTRFYDLGYRVYGLEADETKWTAQSWFSAILGVDKGDFAGMHYQYLPVDFWVRSFFLRIFGLNFLSARIESAVFSVVAVIFLYLLVRRLTASPPLALLTTAIYAFSFIELNGSHQALHNTTLEPWMMAGLYFLVAGIKDRKWWQFQVAGIMLALGMLTYETFFPTVLVALVYVVGTAIYQIIKRQANLRQWLPRLLLTVWPIILTYFTFTQRYLQSRHGYHFGWLDQAIQDNTMVIGILKFFAGNIGDLLKTTFSGVVWQDSLLRWGGSFLDQLILPFVVIGLVYNLCNLRRPHYLFIPIWYLFNIAIAPLLLGSVWPRVLYTSLGPLTVWAAMGLWVFFGALRTWPGRLKVQPAVPFFALTLLVIFSTDYIIFTRGIQDPVDRVKRRELADLTYASAANTPMILYPYFPAQNDSVVLETHVILFSVAGARHEGLEAEDNFRQIPFDQLLLTLWENRNAESLDIFFDKGALALQQKRLQALNVVLQCYPGGSLQYSGKFFDVYHFDAAALSQPTCYQTSPPVPLSPPNDAELAANQPLTLAWDTQGTETTSFAVTIEQHISNVYWIEAEDVFQSQGWYTASEFAANFSGNGFLLDNWQSGETQYSLNVKQTGKYRFWVRSYKRIYNDQQNYISIDGQTAPFAGNNVILDQWNWESAGVFDLPAGPIVIGLGRTYGQDDQYSVFIDAILITPNLYAPPGPESVWKTTLTSEEDFSPISRFTLAEGLPAGEYRWSVRVFDGDKLIDSLGERGIAMPFAGFALLP
jgi:4-amino-4-deoxy-L-arabinose transferase-like glycosyltransferase